MYRKGSVIYKGLLLSLMIMNSTQSVKKKKGGGCNLNPQYNTALFEAIKHFLILTGFSSNT